VVQSPTVTPVSAPPPAITEIERAPGEVASIELAVGPRGPQGEPGADTGASIDAAMALHVAAADPHPGYIDADDTLDGGNF
jgi:hypothetical protein